MMIFGDYFDRDTRALLAVCDYAEVPVDFTVVDTFNGSNLEQSYENIAGTHSIPCIKLGTQR